MRIVFDFAGVLFRWRPQRLLQRMLPQQASDAAAAQRLADAIFQGDGGDWADFDRGLVEPDALAGRLARRTGLTREQVRAVIDAVPAELQPMPDTVALLRRMHAQGRRLHFLSNMPAPYADHLQREHAFLRCFESGVISARVRQIKPEAAIFATAARRFGAAPAELLFIDDVPANVQAARVAGWQALQFVDAADCETRLRAVGVI